MLSPWNILHIHSYSYLTLDQQIETSMPIKLNMCERTISQLPVVISKEVLQTKDSNFFITDSNDQLTAETLAFSSYKTNQNNL
jgi:hypothetical protein